MAEDLGAAALRGDMREVQAALSAGKDPNSPVPVPLMNGVAKAPHFPLHYAAGSGHDGAVRALVAAGAHTEVQDGEGDRPLAWAAFFGRESTVRLLLELGADPEAKSAAGTAAAHTRSAPIRRLLRGRKRQLLAEAALAGRLADVVRCLDAGQQAALPSPDDALFTSAAPPVYPVSLAALRGHDDVVRALVERGADVNAPDGDGDRCLAYAALGGHESTVRLLLEFGARPHLCNVRGAKPRSYTTDAAIRSLLADLHRAAFEGSAEAVRRALDGGQQPNEPSSEELLPHATPPVRALQLAAARGHDEVVRLLVERGAGLELADGDGDRALFYAVYHSRVSTTRLLLELGADPAARNHAGQRPEQLTSSMMLRKILLKARALEAAVPPPAPPAGAGAAAAAETDDDGDDDDVRKWLRAAGIPNARVAEYARRLAEDGFDSMAALQELAVEDLEECGVRRAHVALLARQLAAGVDSVDLRAVKPVVRGDAVRRWLGDAGIPDERADEYAARLGDALGFDSAAALALLRAEDLGAAGVRKAHARMLARRLAPASHQSQSQPQPQPDQATEEYDELGAPASGLRIIEPGSLQLTDTELGSGNFGTAVLGRYHGADVVAKRVAMVLSEADLVREAEIMARAAFHPHVVPFYGVCFQGPQGYIVSEFMRGGTVEALLVDSDAPVAAAEVARMAHEAAKGLVHLHAEGIVHRDIAARNLLLTSREEGLHVKVSDFGMSRVLTALDTRGSTQSMAGPMKRMAPETLLPGGGGGGGGDCVEAGQVFTRASDVFMFGCTLFEMFAREPPWAGVTAQVAALRVINGARLAVPERVPQAAAALMERCWRTAPEERPTMEEVCGALGALSGSLSLSQSQSQSLSREGSMPG